jgi:hypothetical protein
MLIPKLLEDKYRSDHKLNAFVSAAIGRIEGHIKANSLIFFPEYTDHGIGHLESTLQTAADLATPRSQTLITPTDAASLVLAVGLHDLGMYLTRDGFETLIAPESKWIGVEFFDKKVTWTELWERFYSEATRFDDRKLKTLFGPNYHPVKPLPARGQAWEEFDFLLVGEFLRRHHPRLAHEIALYGLPGKDGGAILVSPTDTSDQKFLADVSGLVARSHGLDLRECMSYLENQYKNKIDPRSTHAIFLGVLLRIADYFQIQATRAPTERTDVTSFRSSFSEGEWWVHQSISDVHNSGEDPEAIVVNANPPNVDTFLRLKKWLYGIQSELDQSWAILGEVYALQTHLQLEQLGIKIRRVKSNLDDVEAFSKTVSYVPARIAFEAANTDLLKLLVAPLYGEDAGIGIRELLQNAIDAVREFEDLRRQHPSLAMVDQYDQDSDVVLQINTDETGDPTEIIVTDKGVGMTPEVVKEYFLRAGASFRKSDVWRQEHEDAEGHSRVLRTGRFGVGALATFLLGDEIEVTTRHVQSKKSDGITFRARIDDDSISLLRVECPTGTQIRIKVPDALISRVTGIIPGPWEDDIGFHSEVGHYFLKKPSLKRVFLNIEKELLPSHWLPQPSDRDSVVWRSFTAKNFDKIFWTYAESYPSISCNGIVISKDHKLRDLSDNISCPNISVFDRDGYLPVNLQRTGLQTRNLPFSDELLRSVTRDLLAYSLVTAPNRREDPWFDGSYPGFEHSGYYYDNQHWANWILTPKSFILNDPRLLEAIHPKYMVIGVGGPKGYEGWGDKISKTIPSDGIVASYLPDGLSDSNNRVKGLFQSVIEGSLRIPHLKLSALEAFVSEPTVEKIKKLKPGRDVQMAIATAQSGAAKRGWRHILFARNANEFSLSKTITSLKIDPDNPVMFLIGRIENFNLEDADDILCRHWLKIAGQAQIPYDLGARKKLERKVSPQVRRLTEIYRENLSET